MKKLHGAFYNKRSDAVTRLRRHIHIYDAVCVKNAVNAGNGGFTIESVNNTESGGFTNENAVNAGSGGITTESAVNAESGSFTIESAIIMPIVIFTVCLSVYIALILFQKAQLQSSVCYAAHGVSSAWRGGGEIRGGEGGGGKAGGGGAGGNAGGGAGARGENTGGGTGGNTNVGAGGVGETGGGGTGGNAGEGAGGGLGYGGVGAGVGGGISYRGAGYENTGKPFEGDARLPADGAGLYHRMADGSVGHKEAIAADAAEGLFGNISLPGYTFPAGEAKYRNTLFGKTLGVALRSVTMLPNERVMSAFGLGANVSGNNRAQSVIPDFAENIRCVDYVMEIENKLEEASPEFAKVANSFSDVLYKIKEYLGGVLSCNETSSQAAE